MIYQILSMTAFSTLHSHFLDEAKAWELFNKMKATGQMEVLLFLEKDDSGHFRLIERWFRDEPKA